MHVEDFGGFEEVENQDNWAKFSCEIGKGDGVGELAHSIYPLNWDEHLV